MKARMKVTIVPNTVDAYVSGILIDDDLTPAITTLDGMVGTAFGCFKTSQRDAEVVTIYKNWDVKSAFTTNPLANPTYKVMRQRILWRLKPSLSSIDLSIKQ